VFGLFALAFCLALVPPAPPAEAGMRAGMRPALPPLLDRRGGHFEHHHGQGTGGDSLDAGGALPDPTASEDASPVPAAGPFYGPPLWYPPREPAYVSEGPRLILIGHRGAPKPRAELPLVVYGGAYR